MRAERYPADVSSLNNVAIDWCMYDIKGPRSIETDDIKFMIETGVFANSEENLLRIDTIATRDKLLAGELSEKNYFERNFGQAKVSKSISEQFKDAVDAKKIARRKKQKPRRRKTLEGLVGPGPRKGESYESYRTRYVEYLASSPCHALLLSQLALEHQSLSKRLQGLQEEVEKVQSHSSQLKNKKLRCITTKLFDSLRRAVRMKLRNEVTAVIRRLLLMEIALSGRYWVYYESLDQLRVAVNIFNGLEISFKLECLRAVRPRKSTVLDLSHAS